MSSICGIVDLDSKAFEFERLKGMAKALILRGRKSSCAYVKEGVGLHSNSNEESCISTLERHTGNVTVIFDGKLRNAKELAKTLALPYPIDCAKLVLEVYRALGARAPSSLDGEFAFAIYDERQRELILARDKKGAKPLYYTKEPSRLIFASEIKALLSPPSSCPEVDAAALSELILDDSSSVSTSDLYKNISELPEGCIAIYSRLGLQISSYSKTAAEEAIEPKSTIVLPYVNCPFSIDDALNLSLFAFDRPFFDEYTPTIFSAIDKRSGEIFIEDPRLKDNEALAFERADRLGALCGAYLYPVPPQSSASIFDTELLKTEKKLSDKTEELFNRNSKIKALLGCDFYRHIEKLKNTNHRVRALGMTLQSEIWLCHYPIVAH